MHKVGILGEKDSILGFKILGIPVFPVKEKQEAERTLRAMARDDYGVIYITEKVAALIMDTINMYRDDKFPAIILIPGNSGSMGIGKEQIKKSVDRAVGANIFYEE